MIGPRLPQCDPRVTTDDQPNASATPRRASLGLRLIAGTLLGLATLPALAQTQEQPQAATPDTQSSDTAPARSRTDAAATATLAALLPHLAGNDTIPLMDRSAMFAGDLSRLLANYDVSQSNTVAAAESAVSDSKVQVILKRAMALLGTPYRWGGTSPDGFDCSGLVSYVFKTALGIELPRVSRDMAHDQDAELIKDRTQLNAGDLVFFGNRGRVNHVGIYVGEGRFLHAPSTGKDVKIDSLVTGYWSQKFMQARRVSM